MKNFDAWNTKKKELHEKSLGRFYHERDIWWCAVGLNVGFEQDGKNNDFQRPVLIIKSFSRETCLVAPLTTSRVDNKYRIGIGFINGTENKIILSQIRVVDTKRFINQVGILDQENFDLIRKSIKDIL